ncbi:MULTISPECIES: PepSY-associated TM helix domain-containing protein [Methylobacterium]|uniref:PepSY-associated TM helix domain-containing protein n=1 Tax=Methylobacterium TaxID=407 RepID=UPI0013ED2887|nr:PepSY-associated TM helix domain-containing protein [Methylobacterium sp. DB0501]NGM34148.1 PepSY domain-containing protein [Methylobacterium sp. DB0501]
MRHVTVKRLKRWLYLGHRWLGIVTCLLFATWFVSGLVMMYVGFPTLEEAERRPALPSLDWARIRLSPAEALAAAGEARFPQDLRLAMLDRLPVYRITGWNGSRRTLSAVDGGAIPTVEAGTARAVAGHDPRAVRPVDLGTVARDQWSVTARYDPLRPFHLVALGDAEGTRLYVSARTGEIALDTTGRERFWNWVGAIPHWIYLTPLRAQAGLWRDVVLWVSGVSIAAAVSGFWIGLLRVRVRRRYRDGRPTPYRGWMAWHHLAGTVGGVTLLTFIVSGWLSVNPNRWFASPAPSQATLERYAGVTAPRLDLGVSELRGGVCPDAVEIRFRHVGGLPLAQAACRDGRTVTCCEAEGLSRQRLAGAIGQLMPEAGPARITLLTREDAYWYGHHRTVLLPVLRAVFSDADGTWFHVDPATGEVLNRTDRSARLYRWLFNGLHSWDYGFLIRRRPAWDVAVWALAALGLVTSVSGIVVGWRRLRKRDARAASA